MRVEKDLIRKVLERLYKDYFPDSCFLHLLCEGLGMKVDQECLKPLSAVLVYLKDKGLATKENQGRWRITAEGIDFLEGESLIWGYKLRS